MAKLIVTTVEAVEVADEKAAEYLADLIETGNTAYGDRGFSLGDLGPVTTKVTAATE